MELHYTAKDGQGERLDRFIASKLGEMSRARIQSLIKNAHITLNGSPTKPGRLLADGDLISVSIPAPVSADAQPENIPLEVLHEDEHIIVINKPHGLVVHPAAGNPNGTLVNALLHHCESLSGIGGVERPGIVHRLDKDTSGCLVAAKTDTAHRTLCDCFARHQVTKVYLAVVEGCPPSLSGRIENHISRNPNDRQKMAVVMPPLGKPAITEYKVRSPRGDASLVECRIFTGRTHQIRVHMKSLGTPILGDPVYARPARQKVAAPRLMLHAWKLGFTHPVNGEKLLFENAPPPEFNPWQE
ncbi:MAG: RluA family pseudouridine synthase [Verrucomicrobiales bacterium]|nr:RluA family pseudouridine synthase [Verrucomicrobiales bacterium]MED5585044.1 RluA family pseudouridine synthase [Verrucomicrobiota bacterium]